MLVSSINALLIPSLILGTALLASILAGVEHQGSAWKLLLALSVSRIRLYVSKFIWLSL